MKTRKKNKKIEKLIWLQSQSHESECHSQDSRDLMAVGGYVRGAVQGYEDDRRGSQNDSYLPISTQVSPPVWMSLLALCNSRPIVKLLEPLPCTRASVSSR